jgi:HK97 family phage portal protein
MVRTMNILGFEIVRKQRTTGTTTTLSSVDDRRVWHSILESFPGAWQRNVEVELVNVLTNPIVYACIVRISSDIGKLRLRLVTLTEDGIWVETDSPALSQVLARPNHYQNRIEFIQYWVCSKLTHGNTYAWKERDNRNVVTALHILDPRRVRTLISSVGDVYYEVWEDTLVGQNQPSIVVPASEIIHDKMNCLFHPLVGLSPIFAAGLPAVQGLRIEENSAVFFGNGARPSGVLVAPGFINDETATRMKEMWESKFSGTNAGKIAVLGDGLKYEPMTMSSVDAQMIEQLKWTSETICGCFGVPAYLVGVGNPPLNNNAQVLRDLYYSQCLQIHIEQIEAKLDDGLALKPPYGTEFDLEDLLRMDPAAMIHAYAEASKSGWVAPNEMRKKLGLPPTAGGDTPYLQQQNYSLEALAERDADKPFSLPAPAPVATDDTDDNNNTTDEDDDTDKMVNAIVRRFAHA